MTGSSEPNAAGLTVPGSLPVAGRVLVLEDEPVLRDTVEIVIEIEGCEVETAKDALTGLALLESWTPDVILLDLTLPGMSGAEFIRCYHETEGPHAPIILLTGHMIDGAQAEAMGCAGVLIKPFDATDLLDLVASFTDCDDC